MRGSEPLRGGIDWALSLVAQVAAGGKLKHVDLGRSGRADGNVKFGLTSQSSVVTDSCRTWEEVAAAVIGAAVDITVSY